MTILSWRGHRMRGEQLSSCERCGAERRGKFNGEIAIHFTGLAGLNKPIVWVFPPVAVCFHCGLAGFEVPAEELEVLKTGQNGNDPCG